MSQRIPSVSRHTTRLLFMLIIVSFMGITPGLGNAQTPEPFDPATATSNVATLRNAANTNGSVRVIVELNTNGLNTRSDIDRTQAVNNAQTNFLSSMTGQNYTVIRQFSYIPFMVLNVDSAALDAALLAPGVVGISSDPISGVSLDTSTTQIGARGSGGAWESGYTGTGQAVVVLDTGIDKNHTSLSGRVISEACYGSYDTASTINGDYVAQPACPGGATASTASNSGLHCDLSYTGCDHGTHVGGIIASTDKTHTGVAPDANLISMQVFSIFDGSYCTNFYGVSKCALTFSSDQTAALERVYALRTTYNIASVNMSLGGGSYSSACEGESSFAAALNAAMGNLNSAGIAVIVASGNSGFTSTIGTPACLSNAISVGAVNDSDTVAGFSNSANILDLLAPGVGIYSTLPNNAWANFNGTSMAAPHVAGAWALVAQARPNATVAEILDAFEQTGIEITDTRSGASNRVRPRIQVNDAIDFLSGPEPTVTPTETPVDPTPTPTSTPELTTYGELFVNTGIEEDVDEDKQPDGWTVKSTGTVLKDKMKCNKTDRPNDKPDKIFSHSGDCAFMFKGGAEENSNIKQTVDLTDKTFIVGDTLNLSLYLNSTSVEAEAKVILVVNYADDTPNEKFKGTYSDTAGYFEVATVAPINSENIKKIKFLVKFKGTAGKLYVDDVSLEHTDGTSPTAPLSPLPTLPPATN